MAVVAVEPVGRGGVVRRAWTHWGTSRDLITLRLPTHDAGTGLIGEPLGRAQRGGDFVWDPFDAYRAGLVANPNVVVAGAIGVGKSTVVKMLVDRALRRGRRVIIVDPKGEYGALARAHGRETVTFGTGAWCRPFGPDAAKNRDVVRLLLASAAGRSLTADESFALDVATESLGDATPPRLLAALFDLVSPALSDLTSTPRQRLALLLRRFVHGDLADLFDGAGPPMALDDTLVVVDLSRQWASDHLAVAAVSVVAASHAEVASGQECYVVMDEAWALLADDASLRWLQGSWKLARARGVSHVLVLHRWSDASAVGSRNSAAYARARGLLRECESAWLFRQPPDEADEMAEVLGLGALERTVLPTLERGQALVRYGRARSVVQLTPSARDRTFVDTDAAMRGHDAL